MYASRLTALVVIIGGMVADAGHLMAENKAAPASRNGYTSRPYDTGAPRTGYDAGPYGSASITLAEEYPELVPLLLQALETDPDDLMRKEVVVPALRRLGRSGLPPLVRILEGKDAKQRAVALLCLLELVGPDYPAREAIPIVMKLAKEPTSDDSQGYALVLLTRLIAANEPAPPAVREITACKGDPVFRGPLRVVRFVKPNGQIGEVTPSASERGATVSVYPDYLVLQGNSGLEGYTRYVAYREILELELMR